MYSSSSFSVAPRDARDYLDAVASRNIERVRRLLTQGVDANVDQGAALVLAIQNADEEMISLLIQTTNIFITEEAVKEVIKQNNVVLAEYILESSRGNYCETAVLTAIANGQYHMLHMLINEFNCSLQNIPSKKINNAVFDCILNSNISNPRPFLPRICALLEEQGIQLTDENYNECAGFAFLTCNIEMLRFLYDHEKIKNPKTFLKRFASSRCSSKEMFDFILQIMSEKVPFPIFPSLINAARITAIQYSNVEVFQLLGDRFGFDGLNETILFEIFQAAFKNNLLDIATFLLDTLNYRPSLDQLQGQSFEYELDTVLLQDTVTWDCVLLLIERNLYSLLDRAYQFKILLVAVQHQRRDVVERILSSFRFNLPFETTNFSSLVHAAMSLPSLEMIRLLFQVQPPFSRPFLFGLLKQAAKKASVAMMNFLLHQPFVPLGLTNDDAIQPDWQPEELNTLIKKAFKHGNAAVLERIFSLDVMQQYAAQNPKLFEEFSSHALEYNGFSLKSTRMDYAYYTTCREFDRNRNSCNERISFFLLGRTLYSFDLRQLWRLNLDAPTQICRETTPSLSGYVHSTNGPEFAGLFSTTRVLISEVFGPNEIFVDVVGVGTRHVACLMASPRHAYVLLVALAANGDLDVTTARRIYEFDSHTPMAMARLVCVGEWLAFTNDRYITKSSFNPFAVVDLAAHNSGVEQAYISPSLAELERQTSMHPDLNWNSTYLADRPNSSSDKLGKNSSQTFLILLPPHTTSISDAFEFSFASPHTRSVIADPSKIPIRIRVTNFQDKARRHLVLKLAPHSKKFRLILPSSASNFDNIRAVVRSDLRLGEYMIYVTRTEENMKSILDAHICHMRMKQHNANVTRAATSLSSLSLSSFKRQLPSQSSSQLRNQGSSHQIQDLGTKVVLDNELLPSKEMNFMRTLLSTSTRQEQEKLLAECSQKTKRALKGKLYMLERRPYSLSREQLFLAAKHTRQIPEAVEENVVDDDEEEEENIYPEDED